MQPGQRAPKIALFVVAQLVIVAAIAYIVFNRADPVETVALPAAALPVISPAGGTYPQVSVELSATGAGAEIRYTTDGSEPDRRSPRYSAPFTLLEPTTVRARTYRTNAEPSAITTTEYNVTGEPTFSVPAGSYDGVIKVSIDPGGGLAGFTDDGSAPDEASDRFEEPLLIEADTTLRAINFGITPASVQSEVAYSIEPAFRSDEQPVALYNFGPECQGRQLADAAGDYDLTLVDLNEDASWVTEYGGGVSLRNEAWLSTGGPFDALAAAAPQSGAISLEIWAHPSGPADEATTVAVLGARWETGFAGYRLGLQQQGETYQALVRSRTDDPGDNLLNAPTEEVSGVGVQHLVLVLDSNDSIVRLYQDGAEILATAWEGDLTAWNDFRLSVANSAGGNQQWSGTLYGLAVYADALPADAVAQNFRAGPSGLPSCVQQQ